MSLLKKRNITVLQTDKLIKSKQSLQILRPLQNRGHKRWSFNAGRLQRFGRVICWNEWIWVLSSDIPRLTHVSCTQNLNDLYFGLTTQKMVLSYPNRAQMGSRYVMVCLCLLNQDRCNSNTTSKLNWIWVLPSQLEMVPIYNWKYHSTCEKRQLAISSLTERVKNNDCFFEVLKGLRRRKAFRRINSCTDV